ncbi:hypothetical protein NQ314_002030 [Rhamnusium bicolor]|uniref:MADF domain-containing protein n=1 Tax=Rhamnusium bicolor TaxID=1586634 RepID=A0AAV8ZR59_9CUCU|nr:hypothetical protein NQ314_002030 [Rhamnusium bicolor]
MKLYKIHVFGKIKCKNYSDEHKKNAVYNILVNKLMDVDPNSTKDIVIKEIYSLRTCYRKELKKCNATTKSGTGTEDVHESNLWYYDLLVFMSD